MTAVIEMTIACPVCAQLVTQSPTRRIILAHCDGLGRTCPMSGQPHSAAVQDTPVSSRSRTLDEIVSAVADYYHRPVEEFQGRARHQPLSEQRQVAMYLCYQLTKSSYPQIAALFNRDHTTVVYGVRVVRHQMERQSGQHLVRDVERLTQQLKQAVSA